MSMRAILSSMVLVILIAASSAVDIGYDKPTPIGIVPDGLQKVEESFIKILGQSRHVLSFARFTHRYGKMYNHAEEIKHRFSVFKENLDLIRSTNKKGLSYKLSVNQFADLTWQEFQRNKNIGASQYRPATLKGSHNITKRALLETITPDFSSALDWRAHGIVSPVKDQGQCGSPWAFSVTGAIEAAYHRKHFEGISLSEQQLVDCTKKYGNLGCNGGTPENAYNYIKSKGIASGDVYPYRGIEQACQDTLTSPRAYISGYAKLVSVQEKVLKKLVETVGPVAVIIHVTELFRSYTSGVYSDMGCGDKNVNHPVLVVGYGIEHGVPYWIIKNSWGKKWGEEGYT